MALQKLNGFEQIPQANATIQDFWAWAYSDILSNRNRSIFAEFLVASALGITHVPRVEWDAVDLRYRGRTIEVKSSAYLQSWQQKKLSPITFDISLKRGWDSDSNETLEQVDRSADCYVFCVYEERNREDVNVLDLNQWRFWVIDTERINQTFGIQKSVSLFRLQSFCQPVQYRELKNAIDSALGIAEPSLP